MTTIATEIIKPPMWRTSTFAGEFGDAFIKDTNLEGGCMDASITTFVDIVEKVWRGPGSTNKVQFLSLFSINDLDKLEYIHEKFRKAADIDAGCNEAGKSNEKHAYVLQDILVSIDELSIGSHFIVPGGWSGLTRSGHSIMYVVERTDKQTYSFTVCNTGDGISFHPAAPGDHPKTKVKTAMHVMNISHERITSPSVWFMILHLKTVPSDLHKADAIYEVILPYLADRNYQQSVVDNLDLCGHWESPQRSGTCTFRSILCAYRYIMKTLKFSKLQQKQLFATIRVAFLDAVESDLQIKSHAMALNASDCFMINLACNQTGNAFVKLSESAESAVDTEYLQRIETQIERIKQLLQNTMQMYAGDGEFAEQAGGSNDSAAIVDASPSVASMSADAPSFGQYQQAAGVPLLPFDGFDLLMDASDRNEKKGITAIGSTSLYIDLECHYPHPVNIAAMGDILQWAVGKCNDIRTKSNSAAATVGLHQLCAFVEHLFLSFLTLPPANWAEEVGSSNTCAPTRDISCCATTSTSMWTANNQALTIGEQRIILSCLNDLSSHYIAAHFSLKNATQDRAIQCAASVTILSIFITFDAILRIQVTTSAPLATSKLLSDCRPAMIENLLSSDLVTFQSLFDNMLIMRPEVARARHTINAYVLSLQASKPKVVFDYKFSSVSGSDGMRIFFGEENCSTLEFVNALRVETNTAHLTVPKEGTNRRGKSIVSRVAVMSEIEKAFSWFASAWSGTAPEFSWYRDFNLVLRLFLTPAGNVHGRSNGGGGGWGGSQNVINIWLPHHAHPEFDYDTSSADQQQVTFGVYLGEALINPNLTDVVPQSPISSAALFSSGVNKSNGRVSLTEEDVLFHTSLPNFDHTLSAQEAEKFLSFTLFPHLAVPMCINFFAGDRVALLVNVNIQLILESVIFEPRQYASCDAVNAASKVSRIPCEPQQMSTQYGIAMDEIRLAPQGVYEPLRQLCKRAVDIALSGYKSSVADLLLFLARVVTSLVRMGLDTAGEADRGLDGKQEVDESLVKLHRFLSTGICNKLEQYSYAALEDKNMERSLIFHAHLALIHRNSILLAQSMYGASAWVQHGEFLEPVRKFLSASTFVVAWHSKQPDDAATAAAASASSSSAISNSNKKLAGSAAATQQQPVPVRAVFGAIQSLRPLLCKWLRFNEGDVTNVVLDDMATVALQHSFKECSGWEKVSKQPLVCTLTIGNDKHPYPPSSDWSQTVSFPGTSSINIYFDPRSATEKVNDYVTISYPGCILRFDGPAGSTWPGANGSPALNIPFDTFVVQFHSDRDGRGWGFELTAVAPVCGEAAARLSEKVNCSLLRCQIALKYCCNYEELAKTYLIENEVSLAAEEAAAELVKKGHDGSGDCTTENSPGLYQDSLGYVQINTQTCEVYINNRMSMPVPLGIQTHRDYKALFSDVNRAAMFCTIQSCDTNMQSIQIVDPEGKFGAYQIQAWTPLKPHGSRGTGRGAILEDEDSMDLNDDGRCTAFNMPTAREKESFIHMGRTYVRYRLKSCGWMSALFDRLKINEDDDLVGIWCSKESLSLPDISYDNTAPAPDSAGAAGNAEADGHMLIKMQCSPTGRDLSDIEGHPGAYFEVMGKTAQKLLLVFALVEDGRKVQRQLVYATDYRLALKTLSCSFEFRDAPRHKLLRYEAGNILDTFKSPDGRVVSRAGVGSRQAEKVSSLTVRRSRISIVQGSAKEIITSPSGTPIVLNGDASGDKESDHAYNNDEGALFCALTGYATDGTSTMNNVSITTEDTLEEFVPRSNLEGLIPETLLEEFQFWKTGARIIRGYKYKKSSLSSLSAASSSITFDNSSIALILTKDESKGDFSCTVHRLNKGRREYTLLNPLFNSSCSSSRSGLPINSTSPDSITTNSALIDLMGLFSKVETLSHVLFWSKTSFRSGMEKYSSSSSRAAAAAAASSTNAACAFSAMPLYEISRIELPRMNTAFDISIDAVTGKVDFVLSDHDDLSLCSGKDIPEEIKTRFGSVVPGLVVRNHVSQYFYLVPNFSIKRPGVKACPFSTDFVLDRSHEWSSKVQTRYYMYPIHQSLSFLEMPSMAAALYWILLCFTQRRYTTVAQLINSVCHGDLKLNYEQWFILSQFPKTAEDDGKNADSHPDAHACRLLLALMCLNTGEDLTSKHFPWNVKADYNDYLNKYAHVSQVCRLRDAEEQQLLTIFPKSDRILVLRAKRKAQRVGKDVSITFRGQSLPHLTHPLMPSNATMIQRIFDRCIRNSSEVPPPLKEGENNVRTKNVESMFRFKSLFYRRPTDEGNSAVDAISTLKSFFRCAEHRMNLQGIMSYLGFTFLFELITGQVEFEWGLPVGTSSWETAESADFDCSIACGDNNNNLPTSTSSLATLTNSRFTGSNIDMSEDALTLIGDFDRVLRFQEITGCADTGINMAQVAVWIMLNENSVNAAVEKFFDDHDTAVSIMMDQDLMLAIEVLCCSFGWDRLRQEGKPVFAAIGVSQVDSTLSLVEKIDHIKKLKDHAVKQEAVKQQPPPKCADLAYLIAHYLLVCASKVGESELIFIMVSAREVEAQKGNFRLPNFPFDEHAKALKSVEGLASNQLNALVNPIARSVKDAYVSLISSVTNSSAKGRDESIPHVYAECSGVTAHNGEMTVKANNLSISRPQLSDSSNSTVRLHLSIDDELPPLATTGGGGHADTSSERLRLPDSLSKLLTGDADEFTSFGLSPLSVLPCYKEVLHLPSATAAAATPGTGNATAVAADGATESKTGVLEENLSELPFDVSQHPVAVNNPPAQAMIRRISADLKASLAVSKTASSSALQLSFLCSTSVPATAASSSFYLREKYTGETALAQLRLMKFQLEELMTKDNIKVRRGIQIFSQIFALEEVVPTEQLSCSSKAYRARVLQRFSYNSGKRSPIWFELLVASLTSSEQLKDLQKLNPFIDAEHVEVINKCLVKLLFTFSRATHAASCLEKTSKCISNVLRVRQSFVNGEDIGEEARLAALSHQFTELTAEFTNARHFVSVVHNNVSTSTAGSVGIEFDPRFLVFEFITGFLLRQRQVELVKDFMSAHKNGKSNVHQMIMGAGKTQVIAPLLSLIFADGSSLVTLVCPSSLLPQSRVQLRSRFASILPKKIITLNFERSSEDSNSLKALQTLRATLSNARDSRDIVLTTPQAVKSLFLKYIDLLQQVRHLPPILSASAADVGVIMEAKLRPIVLQGSEKLAMIEVLKDILMLWKSGVALLDEVDLLLHPLKSELNFPIGTMEPLPFLPQRYELPTHILDAFFAAKSKSLGAEDLQLWDEVRVIIEKGKTQLSFQSSPHLILLDERFYIEHLKLPITKYAMVWLKTQAEVQSDLLRASTGFDDVQSATASGYAPPLGHCKNNSDDDNNNNSSCNNSSNTEMVNMLMTMGFERDWCEIAVKMVGDDGDVEQVTNYLLNNSEQIAVLAQEMKMAKTATASSDTSDGVSVSFAAVENTNKSPASVRRIPALESTGELSLVELMIKYINLPSSSSSSSAASAGKQDDTAVWRATNKLIQTYCSEGTLKLLNLTRDWVWTFLPHCLSKIHRVSYGLIGDDDINRWKEQEIEASGGDVNAADNVVISRSRRLLAVPFVGKDVPSRSSEFANPEVQIGLTILAFRLHGLRRRDMLDLLTDLKKSLLAEPGPFSERATRIEFEEWKLDSISMAAAVSPMSTAEGSPPVPLPTVTLRRASSGGGGEKKTIASDILPLELIQTVDDDQMSLIQEVLSTNPAVVTHYVSRFVFPVVLQQKSQKIQANGVDLGGSMLFGRRFGFSGTPSDLLPIELQPCHFEPGSEAQVMRVLSSSQHVSTPEELQMDQTWTVDAVLERVANGPYSALIDTGALITGYTTEEVARKLLTYQRADKNPAYLKEVCVYLDERDFKMVVDRSDNPPYEFDRCGVKIEKRICFYDHVHTTGIDIKHALNAIAVCTLGKDLTLRDYAQGCWRMRGLGKGQTIHVMVIEEINRLIKETQNTPNKLADILAWLTTNSMTSERLQYRQLCIQIEGNEKRNESLRHLIQIQGVDHPSNAKAGIGPKLMFRSPFHEAMTKAEVTQYFETHDVPKLLLESSRKNGSADNSSGSPHTGKFRSFKYGSQYRRYCGTGDDDCICEHGSSAGNRAAVICGDHWSCCGCVDENSRNCADMTDPNYPVYFRSISYMSTLCSTLTHNYNDADTVLEEIEKMAPQTYLAPYIEQLNGDLMLGDRDNTPVKVVVNRFKLLEKLRSLTRSEFVIGIMKRLSRGKNDPDPEAEQCPPDSDDDDDDVEDEGHSLRRTTSSPNTFNAVLSQMEFADAAPVPGVQLTSSPDCCFLMYYDPNPKTGEVLPLYAAPDTRSERLGCLRPGIEFTPSCQLRITCVGNAAAADGLVSSADTTELWYKINYGSVCGALLPSTPSAEDAALCVWVCATNRAEMTEKNFSPGPRSQGASSIHTIGNKWDAQPRESVSVDRSYRIINEAGFLVREDAETTSEIICTLPVNTVVHATQEAFNSQGIIRLRIDRPVCGWVSKLVGKTSLKIARGEDKNQLLGGVLPQQRNSLGFSTISTTATTEGLIDDSNSSVTVQCESIDVFMEKVNLNVSASPICSAKALRRVHSLSVAHNILKQDSAARTSAAAIYANVTGDALAKKDDEDDEEDEEEDDEEESQNDREIVQEQEKEKAQEREVTLLQISHPQADKDPMHDASWKLDHLRCGRALMQREGRCVFYPLREFNIANPGNDAVVNHVKLPFPNNLLVSEAYAPFFHASINNRRLKNVNVVMQWRPLLGAESDAVTAATEKDSEKSSRSIVSTDEHQATELRTTTDSALTGDVDLFGDIFGSANESPSGMSGISSSNGLDSVPLKRQLSADEVLDQRFGGSGVLEEAAEPTEYSVILSLAEAESLRFVCNRLPSMRRGFGMLTGQACGGEDESGGDVALWCIDPVSAGGTALTASGQYSFCKTRSSDGHIQEKEEVYSAEVLREFCSFFDNALVFDDDAISRFLTTFESVPKELRLDYFAQLQRCRLRDQSASRGTSLAYVFEHSSAGELNAVRAIITDIQIALAAQFSNRAAAFKVFVGENKRILSVSDLVRGLASLRYPITLSTQEAIAVLDFLIVSTSSITANLRGEYISSTTFNKLFSPSLTQFSRNASYVSTSGSNAFGTAGLLPTLRSTSPKLLSSVMQQASEASGGGNIFQGHTAKQQQRDTNTTSRDRNLLTSSLQNEFYSYNHTPNIQSIGDFVIASSPTSPQDLAACQGCKLHITNDCSITTNSEEVIFIVPRGVKLTGGSGLWCFEITILCGTNRDKESHSPSCSTRRGFVGFAESTDASSLTFDSKTKLSSSSRFRNAFSISAAQTGDKFRFMIDMRKPHQCDVSYTRFPSLPGQQQGSYIPIFSAADFTNTPPGVGGIYPFIGLNSAFKVRANLGNLPFSSEFGNMPPGGHSIHHWIRSEQERQYVRYRYSLGGYGSLSNASGRFNLELLKLPDEDYQWEMKFNQARLTDKNKSDARYEAAFPTVYLDGVVLTQGQWYYEVTINCNNVATQFGWADIDFIASNDNGMGVGDDKHSWAYDGDRVLIWHNAPFSYGKHWKIGDVLGCACDLDINSKSVSFSLNGEWFEPIAFTGIRYSVGLCPALTTQARNSAVSYTANMSGKWKHKPPSERYRPISEWIEYGLSYLPASKSSSSTCGSSSGGGGVSADEAHMVEPSVAVTATEVDVIGLDASGLQGLSLYPPLPPPPLDSVTGKGVMLMRQESAQPEQVPLQSLGYVPLLVKSGHDLVSISYSSNNGDSKEGNAVAEKLTDISSTSAPVDLTTTNTNNSDEQSTGRRGGVSLPGMTMVRVTALKSGMYPSLTAAAEVTLSAGKWFYELILHKAPAQPRCSFGFANIPWEDCNWTENRGVGDDPNSWAAFYKTGMSVYHASTNTSSVYAGPAATGSAFTRTESTISAADSLDISTIVASDENEDGDESDPDDYDSDGEYVGDGLPKNKCGIVVASGEKPKEANVKPLMTITADMLPMRILIGIDCDECTMSMSVNGAPMRTVFVNMRLSKNGVTPAFSAEGAEPGTGRRATLPEQIEFSVNFGERPMGMGQQEQQGAKEYAPSSTGGGDQFFAAGYKTVHSSIFAHNG